MRFVLVSFICFRNSDFKSLIAYSSVVHMAVGLSSFFLLNKIRYFGIIRVLIAHGICSSGLFFFIKKFYEKSGSRKIFLKKGVLILSTKRVLI